MKKAFVLLMFTMLVIMSSTQSQTNLFKGIYSGVSESEFITYCQKHPDFKKRPSSGDTYDGTNKFIFHVFSTKIGGRMYTISPILNSKNELFGLIFTSMDSFEWMYYANIIENVTELYSLLKNKYGEATYNKMLNWTDIPIGKGKCVCFFERDYIIAGISVNEQNEKYHVSLLLYDKKYEPQEVKDSGGF